MAAVQEKPMYTWTTAKLRRHFGGIPAERILLTPRPGTATEQDLLFMNVHGERLCELVDGCLLEKAMGARESLLAGVIIHLLHTFLDFHPLGLVLGADGALRLMPGLVRVPDVSFISWKRIGADELPETPIPDLAPDLAIEVISKGNTKKEMERKVGEYFRTGVAMVWLVYPKRRTVEVYISPQTKRELTNGDILVGGAVMPGLEIRLADLFTSPRRKK